MSVLSELNVFWDLDLVGTLTKVDDGSWVQFTYSKEWLEGPAFPISVSLPCQEETFSIQKSINFFGNFLPEGKVKEELCRFGRISASDNFRFLEVFGRDMAGALSIQSDKVHVFLPDIEDITDQLEQILYNRKEHEPLNLFLMLKARLSLAGAQDKLPVIYQDGHFFLARGNAPSSHIIKPASAVFEDLPFNEHFCMSLAKNVGLNVQDTNVVFLADVPIYMIKRYDRMEKNGQLFRLHQEDFCQALSIPAGRKYQDEGGPGWSDLCRIITEYKFYNSRDDRDALSNVALFNFIIGNLDAHGKNYSIFHHRVDSRESYLSLTPLYDLCSLYPYPFHYNKCNMSMSIGEKFRPDKVRENNWRDFAKVFGLSDEELSNKMKTMAEAVEEQIPLVLDANKELYSKTKIPNIIAENAFQGITVIKFMADRLQASDPHRM